MFKRSEWTLEYWIWLSQLPGVGPVLQKRLLQFFQTPENIYDAEMVELMNVQGIGKEIAERMIKIRLEKILPIVEKINKKGIKVVTIADKQYEDIFSCKRAPILFFYKGTLPSKRGIAIVGARRCTEDAKRAAEEIAHVVAKSGYSVISGMAKGVDSYAHTACLKAGGQTMAILANGVDLCYPKEHKQLYEEILANGGTVLSAFPPRVVPIPKYFVERNAHISAWSTDVIVVQASEKSGSLTTAQFALDDDRNLFAVPHSIYLKEAKGSNQLLEQGAKPYITPQSLGIELVETRANNKILAQNPPLTPTETKILAQLKKIQRCQLADLAHFLTIPQTDLHQTLMLMEMNNLLAIKGTTVTLIT